MLQGEGETKKQMVDTEVLTYVTSKKCVDTSMVTFLQNSIESGGQW